MRHRIAGVSLLSLLCSAALVGQQPAAAPPASEKKPVVDQYFGVKIGDDYRWLENWDDPSVKAWSDAQNAYARRVLDGLGEREAIRGRLRQIVVGSRGFSQLTARGHRLFAMENEPPRQQPFLVTLADADDPGAARVLVDPAAAKAAIDFFEPSPDGTLVAVSLSTGGSERGDLHVYDVSTGKETAEIVPRANNGTAGGSVCWTGDGKGFFYTRYPRPGERPAADLDFFVQIYHHALGTPADSDRYELGKDFPRIAEPQLACSADGRFVVANVQNGDSGAFAQFLRSPDGRWTPLTRFTDGIAGAFFGPDDSLYLISHAAAPHGKVLRLKLASGRPASMANATTVVPESPDAVIDADFSSQRGLVLTGQRLYVLDLMGGPSQVRVFDLNGRALGTLPLPDVSTLNEIVALDDGSLLYKTTTYVEPATWFSLDGGAAGARPQKRALSNRSPVDLSGIEVKQELATSKDGTKVPLTIVRRKGLPGNRATPTLLTGYGGYGLSQRPFFLGGQSMWLEQGGIYARAVLRGGGEFGETWHDGGRLTRKQNVFDDFIACAEHLIKAGYTDAAHLAIEGGSNGGLLMGAVMTQRPELFKAVVSHVGIYDMLRVELSPNGAFNVPEFGTVKDGDQFRALRAYSPYHKVTDGVKYPPTLFLTGANDPRVDPMHSRKMTARLQAATTGAGTVLLRTSSETGHGIGTPLDLAIEESVDVYAFLFHELGMRYRQVP